MATPITNSVCLKVQPLNKKEELLKSSNLLRSDIEPSSSVWYTVASNL